MIISEFFEIKIRFDNNNEYSRPYFYAEYNGYKVSVDILKYKIIEGYMPRNQTNLILGWCALYEDELIQNWELMLEGRKLNKIQGLKK